ncbi:hypothetical protein, partial [Burkholderia gladioli]
GNTVLAENRLHALIGLAIRGARASQTAAPQANVAGERAAFVEKLRELGADISPLGSRDERLCITSNIMVDDVLAAARASQAAAPADAALSNRVSQLEKALVYVGHRLHDTPQYMLCDGVALIDNDGITVKAQGIDVAVSLRGDPQPTKAAAPAEARDMEDPVLVQRGLLGAACAAIVKKHPAPKTLALLREITQNAKTVTVPADAGEAVAPVVAALRKLVHLKSLKDGADRCVPGYIEDRIEYQRDKPKAWDDARAALASFDAAQGAQGGKGGEA